tara:strand:+ start:935 stop:1066 length:132 start_codon:yes stop_codon:yes gene_type:complete
MEPFVVYCVVFVGIVNFVEITYKIYKNKEKIKKYLYNKYNGYS